LAPFLRLEILKYNLYFFPLQIDFPLRYTPKDKKSPTRNNCFENEEKRFYYLLVKLKKKTKQFTLFVRPTKTELFSQPCAKSKW